MPTVPTTYRAKKLAIHLGTAAPERVEAMLARQNLTKLACSRRSIAAGSIGCLGDIALPEQGNACFFIGLPINGVDMTAIQNAGDAALRFPEFDGAFVGVFWDATAAKLVVATDFLGVQPLYLRRQGQEIELASETKAFAATPDMAGWGAFIAMGHTIGQRTLLEGVQRLPPATLLTYDTASGDLRVERYWNWPSGGACTTREVVQAFQASAVAYQAYRVPATLMLSGGFDSRLLLYSLRGTDIRPDALIVSHQDLAGDTDGRLGKALARRENLDFRVARPPTDFFSSADFLDYVVACDAAIPTMHLFITKLFAHIHGGAIWDGLVPGFALRLVFRPGTGFTGYVREHCRGWEHSSWQVARILFGEETARAMHYAFEEALRDEICRFDDDDTGIFHFIAENRIRHRTSSNPLKVLSQRTLAYIPGMTKAFFELVSNLPSHTSGPNDFYVSIFQECFPAALNIPILKGDEFILANGARWWDWRYRAFSFRNRMLGLYPSMNPSRYIGPRRHGTGPHSSSFLQAEGALLEDDHWLDLEAIRGISPTDPLYERLRILLFHWKAWQWVHQSRLHDMLAPYASNRDRVDHGLDV